MTLGIKFCKNCFTKMTSRVLLMICMLIKFVLMNYILSSWIFDQTDTDTLEQRRGAGWEDTQGWIRFDMWISIELFTFIGSIVSCIFYLFVRSFFKSHVQISGEADGFSDSSDHIQANYYLIEINEAYLSVLLTSILLYFQ